MPGPAKAWAIISPEGDFCDLSWHREYLKKKLTPRLRARGYRIIRVLVTPVLKGSRRDAPR